MCVLFHPTASEEMLGASKQRHEPTQDPIPLAAGIFQRHSAQSPASFLRNSTGTGARRGALLRTAREPRAEPGSAAGKLRRQSGSRWGTAAAEPSSAPPPCGARARTVAAALFRSGLRAGPPRSSPGLPAGRAGPARSHSYGKGRSPPRRGPRGPVQRDEAAPGEARQWPERGATSRPQESRRGVVGDLTPCPPRPWHRAQPPSLPAFPRAAPRGASPPAAVRGRHPPRSAPPAPSRPRSGRRHFDSKPLPRPGRRSGHGACAAALRSLGHVVRGSGGVGGGLGLSWTVMAVGAGAYPVAAVV